MSDDNDFDVTKLINETFHNNTDEVLQNNVSKQIRKKSKNKNKKSKNDIIIGIDLGTTHSCVSIWRNGCLEIIRDENGKSTIPSVVSFTKHNVYIGNEAKRQIKINPESTYYDIKRLIGRKKNDATIKSDEKFLTYDIDYDENDNVVVKCDVENRKKTYTPEEISSLLLMRMKNMAEEYLKQPVNKAVITVPAYFNDAQREATKHASEIIGLNCIRIINEPTAAALAYGFENTSRYQDEDINIVVYDLGGGTLDVSLLNISDGVFEVIASTGNTHLGGEDFDHRMIQYCLSEFSKKYKCNLDNITAISMQKLKSSCETAKKMLSSTGKAYITVENFYDGNNLIVQMTKKLFEKICSDLFILCMKSVHDVLATSEYDIDDIDEIILVGGSTRIPLIRENIQKFFKGKKPNTNVNPDEVVAAGAAIQGYLIANRDDAFTKNIVFLDVIPLSLGVETIGGAMNVLIPRNTHIPYTKTKKYTTYEDNVDTLDIKVYEGERKLTKDNFLLGKFQLNGIEKVPRGIPEIKVKFSVDVNGIISITATDLRNTDNQNQITVNSKKSGMTKSQIDELIATAKKFESDDKLRRNKLRCNMEIEDYLDNIKKNVLSDECKLKKNDQDNILEDIEQLSSWLNEKPYFKREINEFRQIIKKIQGKYSTLIIRSTGENDNVKANNLEKNEGTTVFGNEDDEETIFQQMENEEFGLNGDISKEERNEIKNLRNTLNEHCMNIFSILNSDILTISDNDIEELKDYLNEILLSIHVKENLNKLQYVQLINDVNENCNKLIDNYMNNNKEVFIENEINRAIINKKSELEMLCNSIKSIILCDHLPLKSDSIQKLDKLIDETNDWMVEEEFKKEKAKKENSTYITEEKDYQIRIDLINDLSEKLSHELMNLNINSESTTLSDISNKKHEFRTIIDSIKNDEEDTAKNEQSGLTLEEIFRMEMNEKN